MSGPILTASRTNAFPDPLCWPLLPVPDEHGRIGWPTLEQSIRQRIEVILRTSPGEQLMRPRFGAGLEQLIHQPNTAGVRAEAEARIAAHLRDFEPRIAIDHVDVSPGETPDILAVTIAYCIRATGASANLSAAVPIGAV